MRRIIVLSLFLTMISCQDKVICPAYQSTYILDDKTRDAYFSYVWQLDEETRAQYLSQQRSIDSTRSDSLDANAVIQPKTDYYAYAGDYLAPWRPVRKTKYGIVKPVFYPIKKYRMRTAPMENILAPEPLSNTFEKEEFKVDSLQIDSPNVTEFDSLTIDTTLVAVQGPQEAEKEKDKVKFLYGYDPKDNFNVEQEYYNKYFKDLLFDKYVEFKPEPVIADSMEMSLSDSIRRKKEPFFKRLFKKKATSKEQKEDPSEEKAINRPEEGTLPDPEPTPEDSDGDEGQI